MLREKTDRRDHITQDQKKVPSRTLKSWQSYVPTMQEINDRHKDIDIWDEVPGWAVGIVSP